MSESRKFSQEEVKEATACIMRSGLDVGKIAPDIEIVSHCYGYSALLRLQLSSLFRFPPDCRVMLTVLTCEEDLATRKEVDWFAKHPDRPAKVGLSVWLLPNRIVTGKQTA